LSQCSSGPNHAVDDGRDFRVVQTIFRLTLKLRLLEKRLSTRDDALADVLGRGA
jgi:hypothetical protein